jgi:hypothetical protein
LKARVTRSVGLEGGTAAVMTKAVRLDDQRQVPPQEVDLVGPHTGVYLGARKGVTAAQPQEESLQFASSEIGLGIESRRRHESQVERSPNGPR